MQQNPETMQAAEHTEPAFADPEPDDAATRVLSPSLYSTIKELTADGLPPGLAAAVFETIREQQDQIAARDAEIAATKHELAAARSALEERLARIEASLPR